MICSFCKLEANDIGWDETSHLGARPICYKCIGKRDLQKMERKGSIVLYKEKNNLVNSVKTIAFKIKTEEHKGDYSILYFFFNKKKWIGIFYQPHNMIFCKKC